MFYLFYLYQLVKIMLLPGLISIIGTCYIVRSNSSLAKYFRKFFEL